MADVDTSKWLVTVYWIGVFFVFTGVLILPIEHYMQGQQTIGTLIASLAVVACGALIVRKARIDLGADRAARQKD